MTQDALPKIVRKTGSSKKKKQHAVGCKYMYIVVNGHQLTVYLNAGVRRELRNQFIAASNGKPPWWTKAFFHTVREIEHHDVVRSGIFGDEFPHKHPREWTTQVIFTLEEATEADMVEPIAESHCFKQQLISGRFSKCRVPWQGKEVGYSWNSPTWAWP